MEYLKLAALWIGWCSMHSLLITPAVTRYLQQHLGNKYHYFRLFYNILAIISLILIWRYNPVGADNQLFSWDGYLRLIQLLLFVSSALLFVSGARTYDMLQFLGLRQLFQKTSNYGLSTSGGLVISGILGYTRHPWYLAGIILIWTSFSDLLVSRLIVNVILTSYMIVGTYLEERKLLMEFGDEYREYQKQVGMFFPTRIYRG